MKKIKDLDLHTDVNLSDMKKKTKGTMKEFKEFALKGNLIDMAIGVVIGGAFGNVVNSLVNDIIMPLVTLATGKIDFENMFIALDGNHYDTLAQAKEVGAATLNYGTCITFLVNFLIIALSIFFVVKLLINPIKKAEKAAEEKDKEPEVCTTKECPFCKSTIHIDATRCPNCTSELNK